MYKNVLTIRDIKCTVSFMEVFLFRYFMAPESVNYYLFFLIGLREHIKAHASQAKNAQYIISLTFNRSKHVVCSQTSVSTWNNQQHYLFIPFRSSSTAPALFTHTPNIPSA